MNSSSKPNQDLLNQSEAPAGRQTVYCFEGYVVDTLQWQVHWHGEPVSLHRKSFDLLLFLLENRGRVVSKDEIFNAIWPDQFVEENNLSQQVFLLRKAFSRHSSGSKIIETVPSRGYRFAAVPENLAAPERVRPALVTETETIARITFEKVEEFDETDGWRSPARPPSTSLVPALPAPARSWRKRLLAPALIACGFVVCAVAGWWTWQRMKNDAGGPSVQVVLMPLEGSTGDGPLDRTLGDAFRLDMTQSPFITLVPSSVIATTL